MQKILFAIFAHPDDESFGPSGTLLKEVRENNTQVHLITLTTGQNGTNPDNHDDLGSVRLKEWHNAGALIGATSQHHLSYTDGELNNNAYHDIADAIRTIIHQVLETSATNSVIELMSNDLNGISGHIDHIVAARVACYVFYTEKADDPRFSRIRLACVPESRLPAMNTDWLYMEAGRPAHEIDEVVDARAYRDEIIAIMRCHHTQRGDGEGHISRSGDQLGMNYFIVKR